MPKSRYTDAFGFTRDVNTTLDAKSQSGYFEYKHTYSYLNGSESVTTEKTIEKRLGLMICSLVQAGMAMHIKSV